jgi:uncharacterized protein YqjF (DUF2071 family)
MARPWLREIDHRPYPLPAGRWFMAMRWHDLAFLHWPVPAETLRPLIPAALDVDTRDGLAWLGIVPFHMTGVRPWFTPSLPGFSAFPELNVRTYVVADGRPGVWFFSLDAHQPLAVRAARQTYCLPYFDAEIRLRHADGWIDYESRRRHRGAAAADFSARYRPIGPVFRSEPGTLEHWLTERYCLYCADGRGQVHRADIHHAPWPLQRAEADLRTNTMTAGLGIALPDEPPLAHFSRFIDTVAWWRVPAGESAAAPRSVPAARRGEPVGA